jgi:hypothetical protein
MRDPLLDKMNNLKDLQEYMYLKLLNLILEFAANDDVTLEEINDFVDNLSDREEISTFLISCEKLLERFKDKTISSININRLIRLDIIYRLYLRINGDKTYLDITSKAEQLLEFK